MSDADADERTADSGGGDAPGLPTRIVRTVTPGYRGRPDVEMDSVGWAIALGMVVLLVPLLPFLVIVWALSKLFEALAPDFGADEDD